MDKNCFLCQCNLNEVDGGFVSEEDSQELSSILYQIVSLPHVSNDLKKLEYVIYCHPCKRILNMWNSLIKLEKIEKKVLEEKYYIHLLWKENYLNNFNSKLVISNEQFGFLSELDTEMRFTSIKSKLTIIIRKKLDHKLCSKTKSYRMKNVLIFKNLNHEKLEENVSKLCIPNNLASPLISDLNSVDEEPVLSERFSNLKTSPQQHLNDEDDNLFNTLFNESEFPVTSHVYDFHDMKIQTFKTEPCSPTEDNDPFEGIISEWNCDEPDSKVEKMIIGETATGFRDSIQLEEQSCNHSKEKHSKCHPSLEEFISQKLVRTDLAEKYFKSKNSNKTFSYMSNLEIHESIQTEETQFKCERCRKVFNIKSNLEAHKLTHTEKLFKCGYCDKTYFTKSNRKDHELTHTGEKPYKCKYYQRGLTSETNFKFYEHEKNYQHMEKIMRPYKCQYCENRYLTKMSLKMHEIRHTGKKLYKCVYCEKTFYTKCNWKSHERIHTGEKPYKCKFCDKVYPSQSSTINHERTHKEQNIQVPSYDGEKTFG